MKIAAFLPRLPWPLEKGDKLRAYHLLRQLSRHHEIYLFALSEEKPKPQALEKLKEFCQKVEVARLSKWSIVMGIFKALQKGWPLQVGYYYHPRALQQWKQFVDEVNPDHFFFQLIRSLPYLQNEHSRYATIDFQDAFSISMDRLAEQSAVPAKWVWKREARAVARFEQMATDLTRHQLIISRQDLQHLAVASPKNTHIITNGIDVEYFQPLKGEKEYDLIFAGNMGYRPNIMAAKYLVKQIMPEVWAQRPETTVALVGINPAPAVKQLAGEQVKVTGFVNHITEWYAKSRILVAPMQTGAGLQNKILEAMAMELPCVITDIAQKGLPANAHDLTLTENNARDLAEAILTLLADERYAQMLGRQGRKYVETAHSWKQVGEKLEEVIKR